MDFIEENEAEDFAHSRDTSKPVPAVGIIHFGLFDDIEFEVIEELVVDCLLYTSDAADDDRIV
mgnify:CR=1 FL=1